MERPFALEALDSRTNGALLQPRVVFVCCVLYISVTKYACMQMSNVNEGFKDNVIREKTEEDVYIYTDRRKQ